MPNAPTTNMHVPDGTIEKSKWLAPGVQEYVAVAVVDGQQLTVSLTQFPDDSRKAVDLMIGKPQVSGQPKDSHYTVYDAQVSDSSNYVALPHKVASAAKGWTKLTDVINDRIEGQDRRAYANEAKHLVGMVNEVMTGVSGKLSPDDFRQIRDAFQKIDHAAETASNAHLGASAPQNPKAR